MCVCACVCVYVCEWAELTACLSGEIVQRRPGAADG